jgi:hypothetical protein
MSNSPAHIQTVSEASGSISNVAQSTFSSLANTLGLPQLRDSFFQNIIYILIAIIILVGILVYIQMVGPSGNNPLNLPPTKEIKKVEIRKIVEGFDISDNSTNSIADYAQIMPDSTGGGHDGGETDLHLAHTEDYEEQFSKRKRH